MQQSRSIWCTFRVISSFLIAVTLSPAFSVAAVVTDDCEIPDVPVNKSEVVSFAETIKPCIDTGVASDPPAGWIPQAGKLRGSFGNSYTGKAIINVDKSSMGCPQSTYRNVILSCRNAAFQYPDCTARPGGVSHNGGLESCARGEGTITRFPFAIPRIPFPGFGLDFPPCLDKFLASVQQWPTGGFVGMFATNVSVTGSINPAITGSCAAASASFCGFGTGGEICMDSEEEDALFETIRGNDVLIGADNYQGDVIPRTGAPCRPPTEGECSLLILSDLQPEPRIIELPMGTTINFTDPTLTVTNDTIGSHTWTLTAGEIATLRNAGTTAIRRGILTPD